MHYQTFTHTLKAIGAGVQKRFVTYTGQQAGAADKVFGIAKTNFETGDDFAVDYAGIVGVIAGGAIAVGAEIIPDAQGRAIADTGNATNRAGRAVSAVTAPGQTVFVHLK